MKHSEHVIGLTANFGRDRVALQSVHAQGRVDGLLLRMTLRQVYRNTSGRELETVYGFPLAWGTTLLGMRVELNGRMLTGTVLEKSDAETRYEQAIENGDLPVMLVSEGKNLYSARLGNLKPGDEAVIEIDYGQLLAPEGGRTRIVVPTTIAPRFGRDPGLRGLIAHALGAVDPLAEYRFSLTLDVQGPLARGRIACPSHRVSQQITEHGISVQLAQKAMLDRDFILTIDTDDLCSAVASPDPGEGTAATLLCSVVPQLPAPAHQAALRLKILIDCSGSMAGDSMLLAKAALAAAIAQLTPADAVSYSRFGSHAVHLINRLRPANLDTLARLQAALSHTAADLGGTELQQALTQVIGIPGNEGGADEAVSILLITDGEVWDIDAVVTTARQSGHQVFVIGVGSSPAESLVRELAEVTGGAAEFASPGEDMSAAATRLLAKMRSMRDWDISADIDGEAVPLVRSRYRAAPGDTISLWCSLERRPLRAPRILVTDRHSGEQQTVFPGELQWEASGDIARIGAAQRLLDMTDAGSRREVALRYQLLTDETRFFLVHERAEADKAAGMPVLQHTGNMLAAGWGGSATLYDMHASPEVPSFCRRQVDVADDLPAAFSAARINTGEIKRMQCIPEDAAAEIISYASFGQALAHIERHDNPLQYLATMLLIIGRGAEPVRFAKLIELVEQEPDFVLLKPVLAKIEAIVGSRTGALALLLDWLADHYPKVFQLQDAWRQVIVGELSMLLMTLEDQGRAYLDAEAACAAEQM